MPLVLQEMLLYFEKQISDCVGTGRSCLEVLSLCKKRVKAVMKSPTCHCLVCLPCSHNCKCRGRTLRDLFFKDYCNRVGFFVRLHIKRGGIVFVRGLCWFTDIESLSSELAS